jgi:hypothetical protein
VRTGYRRAGADLHAAQDGDVEFVGRGIWRGTELVVQLVSEPRVGPQREGTFAGPVVRQHQRPVGRLVQAVVGDGRLGQDPDLVVVADGVRAEPGKMAGLPDSQLVLDARPLQPVRRR